jgi:hypothetical protein
MSFGIPVRNGLSIGLLASTFLSSRSSRNIVASLILNFTDGIYRALGMNYTFGDLITFTRSTTATFVGSNGLIQTAAIDAPRFDYNPVTLAANGLLIEAQRTNLLLYSDQFQQATWSKVGVVTANATTAPDGTTTADSAATDGSNAQVAQGVVIASGATMVGSVYLKPNGLNAVEIVLLAANNTTPYARATFNVETGVISVAVATANGGTNASAAIAPAGNGWYRCSVTVTYPATTSAGMRINAASATGAFYGWGAQLEAGAFATSYIPTVASTVTRAADIASMTGTNFSSWYNQTEGTFVASADTVNIATGSVIMVGSDDSNRVQIGHTGSTDAIFRIVNVGVSANPANIAATKTGFKAALAYKQSNAAASAGGSAVTTSSPTSMVAHTAAYLGANAAGGLQINGHIRTLTYYPSRLSDAQLQALTA